MSIYLSMRAKINGNDVDANLVFCASAVIDLFEEVVSDLNRYGAQMHFSVADPTLAQLVEWHIRSGGFGNFLKRKAMGGNMESRFRSRAPLFIVACQPTVTSVALDVAVRGASNNLALSCKILHFYTQLPMEVVQKVADEIVSFENRRGTCWEYRVHHPTMKQLVSHYIDTGGLRRCLDLFVFEARVAC